MNKTYKLYCTTHRRRRRRRECSISIRHLHKAQMKACGTLFQMSLHCKRNTRAGLSSLHSLTDGWYTIVEMCPNDEGC